MADGDEIQALGEVADFERAVLDGAAQAIPLSESRRVVETIGALLRVGGGSTRSS
jgi:hypothetical protein